MNSIEDTLINIPISLCIPTKNRYDSFLNRYMEQYVTYLDRNIIDEIIICDEDGNDYNKFLNNDIYKKYINSGKLKLYKNDKILGVFQNKLNVASRSMNEFIALIDSDNFCDELYFNTAREYILNNKNTFSEYIIIAPSKGKPNFDFTYYEGQIITKKKLGVHFKNPDYAVLLNTGNYVITKTLIKNIKYHNSSDILFKISACDVMYFLLLSFQQFDEFQFHIVKDLSYEHSLHDDSEYVKMNRFCNEFREKIIKPQFVQLWKQQLIKNELKINN